MKLKIKSFNGELPNYLTVGKVYESTYSFDGDIELPYIYSDDGSFILLCTYECDHLNGGSWEVVDD